MCDKVFDSADLLNQHSKTHSGDKRFSCSYCGKLFISMVQLEVSLRYFVSVSMEPSEHFIQVLKHIG